MFKIFDHILADTAYFINLDSSKDRLENVISQCKYYHITDLNRFSAIKNVEMPQASATDSHIEIFKYCDTKNIESVAVFEDDFQFYDDVSILRQYKIPLITYLNKVHDTIMQTDWDVFFLGFNPKKKCIPINPYMCKVFKSTGAWAYIIKKNAYRFLIDSTNYSRDRLAIDDLLPMLTNVGFKCYASTLSLCNHGRNFISTLQPSLGYIDYSEWILGNYHSNVWNYMEPHNNYNNAYDILNQLYIESDYARNFRYNLNNFNGDISILSKFDTTYPDHRNAIINIYPNNFASLEYFVNIESNNLFDTGNTYTNIADIPNTTQNLTLL
jgi:GR25 family glycosyltransferase involved in LPS biosynthesis